MLNKLLNQAEKPGRYIGGEINACYKTDPSLTRFGFCFPDIYEVAMSNLALQILYFFINDMDGVYCERFFAPWTDMEHLMRQNGIPLTSLETKTPAAEFDILGFTLQYELSYTNIINMLDLARIPVLRQERGDSFPIIMGGGPGAYNPEPLADVFDVFYIGDGEAALGGILSIYNEAKKTGAAKAEVLKALSGVEGVYVPAYPAGMVTRVYVKDLDKTFFPDRFIVPVIEAVQDRVSPELFRGCPRGCRFCHAGFTSRPVRERSVDRLMQSARELIKNTGHSEISLVSLSTGDYSRFNELADRLAAEFLPQNINLSLPSLRADCLAEKAAAFGRSGLTIAPEAGSKRMRGIINKGLTEDEILQSAYSAFEAGVSRVKLYFMAGLPLETEDDLAAIPVLCEKILGEYYKIPKGTRANSVNITVSGACFVPKPHTPFQWEAQNTQGEFIEKHRFIKSRFTRRQIKYNYHDAAAAVIEGALSRGDRRMGRVLIKAWEHGARFDGWTDKFDYGLWERAFADCGTDPAEFTGARDIEAELPWGYINTGVSREFLLKERERAYLGITTPRCTKDCKACGVCV